MQISQVSNNNPNFQKLSVTRSTLKGLGTTREALMGNNFLKKWSEEYDIFIKGKNGSLFSTPTEFAFSIGKKGTEYLFKSIEELGSVIEKIKAPFYRQHAETKYQTELKIFEEAEKGNYFPFITQSDYLIPRIASIPDEPEYKEIREEFLSALKKLRVWIPVPKNGRRLADEGKKAYWESLNMDRSKSAPLLALENNNLELLKFLLSKGENPNQCLDLMKRGLVSDEAKEILKNVKWHDAKIFDLESCFESRYLREQFFEANADIDINSRNRYGDTLVTKAFKDGNRSFLEYLTTRKDVNWNAYDSHGKNAAFITLEKETVEEQCKTMFFLRDKLGDEKYDITACSVCDIEGLNRHIFSPLEYAVMKTQHHIDSITKFKNADVMEQIRKDDEPLIFRAIDQDIWLSSNFEPLIKHPSFDIYATTKDGVSVVDYAAEKGSKSNIKVINRNMPEFIIKKAKDLYNKNGELTIEEMDMLLDSLIENKASRDVVNSSINLADEGFGHLMCDIPLDINDFKKMCKIASLVNKLVEAGGWECLSKKNLLGLNMVEKAIEGENLGLIKLLVERFNLKVWRYEDALSECNNPEVRKLFGGKSYEY